MSNKIEEDLDPETLGAIDEMLYLLKEWPIRDSKWDKFINKIWEDCKAGLIEPKPLTHADLVKGLEIIEKTKKGRFDTNS